MMDIQFGTGMFIAMFFAILVVLAVVVFLTVFWILMILDCVQRKRMSDGERVAWILVLIFLQFMGALIYYFAVKRK